MSAPVLYESMSLDGFIAGPNERPDHGLGDGGERLHLGVPAAAYDDVGPLRSGGVNGKIIDEAQVSTGAVVAYRGTFEPAWGLGAVTTTTACRLHHHPQDPDLEGRGRWLPM